MELYIELDEGVRYNRSTGIIRFDNKRRKAIELTVTEMKIADRLFDWKGHNIKELEEATGKEEISLRMHISRLKKKIKRYIELKGKRGEYKCERIKSEKERQ